MKKQILTSWDDINFNEYGFGISKYKGRYGIVNYDMEIMIPLIWKSIEFINDGSNTKTKQLAIVKKSEHKVFLIDFLRNEIVSKEYHSITRYFENDSEKGSIFFDAFRFKISNQDDFSLKILDFEGVEYVDEEADSFLSNLKKQDVSIENKVLYKQVHKKELENKYALATEDGSLLTLFIFDSIADYQWHDDLIIMTIGSNFFLIDNQGLVLLKNQTKSDMFLCNQSDTSIDFENILHFKSIQKASWESKNYKVLIDNSWHLLLPNYQISKISWKAYKSDFQYDYYRNYHHQKGFPFIIRNTFEEAIINNEGNFIKDWYFKGYRKMSNGLIIIRRAGLIGLYWCDEDKIEKRTHWIDIKDFDNQYIIVKMKKNEFVFVDEKGIEKIDLIFQDIKKDNENRTLLKQHDKWILTPFP
jgi:hypothetical protein